MPTFTASETAEIAGSSDFLGINFYTTDLIKDEVSDLSEISYLADSDTTTSQDPYWYRLVLSSGKKTNQDLGFKVQLHMYT